jgi:GABA(A) receptor-associated protein
MYLLEKRFIDKYTFFERKTESSKIMAKYPDRFPIICERNLRDIATPHIDKHKYLLPFGTTLGHFIQVIRKRINLPASSALFLFVGDNNTIFPIDTKIEDIYCRFKNLDGFLYIVYSMENVFG